MIVEETWKVIPEFPNYEASDAGKIRHLFGQQEVTSCASHGYRQVCVKKDGRWYTKKIHYLVLLAFVGPRPKGMQTRHLNGIKHDNRLENLKYGTAKENSDDKKLHGTMELTYQALQRGCRHKNRAVGSLHTNSKYSDGKIIVLKMVFSLPVDERPTQKELSKIFNINLGIVGKIARNETWKHIPGGLIDLGKMAKSQTPPKKRETRCRKISKYVVSLIRYLYEIHEVGSKEQANWFNLSREQIRNIVSYRCWI